MAAALVVACRRAGRGTAPAAAGRDPACRDRQARAGRDAVAAGAGLVVPARRRRAAAVAGPAAGAAAQRPGDDDGGGSLRQHAHAGHAACRPAGQPLRRGGGDRQRLHQPAPRRRDGADPVRQPGVPGHAADLRLVGGARATADRGGGTGRRPDRDRRRHRRGGEALGRPARGGARAGAAHRRREQRRQHRPARGRARRQGRRGAHLCHRHRRHRDAGAGVLRLADGQPLGRSRCRHAQDDHQRNRRALLPRHRQP
ncbi:hypothetical protein RLIN73S_00142 [Rhodanobacter lindaniclasticus]